MREDLAEDPRRKTIDGRIISSDLGGDSLNAMALVSTVQKQFNIRVMEIGIFDFPVLEDFAAHLDELKSADTQKAVGPRRFWRTCHGTEGEDDLLRSPCGLAGRAQEKGLTDRWPQCSGSKDPIFWCVQAQSEFETFSEALDPQYPLFLASGLYLKSRDTRRPSRRRSHSVTREIIDLCATGPMALGGYCGGGRLAFRIAEILVDAGHEVALLCLQAQFVNRPYAGRIAFFLSSERGHGPYRFYHYPERGLHKTFTGEVSLIHRFDFNHNQCYHTDSIRQSIRELLEAIDGKTESSKFHRPPSEHRHRFRQTFTKPKLRLAIRGGSRVHTSEWYRSASRIRARIHGSLGTRVDSRWMPLAYL